jgi:LPS export ABC transporter protein LptC
MQELTRKRAIAIGLRARVPLFARITAFALLAAGIAFVGVSYYKLRNTEKFRVKSEKPELSKEVTGIVEGYEQRVTKGDRLYLLVRASRDITFADSHHELENVTVAVYPEVGDVPDQISASRAIYQPTTSVISFVGNVRIETKEKLKVNTEALSFDQNSEVAQTDSALSFERENVTGRSMGAVLEQKTKRLELKKDVEITVSVQTEPGTRPKPSSRERPVTIRASHGVFENESLRLTFSGGATAEQESDIMSGDTLIAVLNAKKRIEKAEVRANSYLRVMDPGRAAEVHAVDMDFYFDQDQRIQRAVATRDVAARTLDADSDLQMTGGNELQVTFQAEAERSLLKEMSSGGRSVVTLSAPKSKANDPRAASKRLTADSLKLTWRSSGRDLERAEATGNAELVIEPIVKNARADSKTLTAPQLNCDFFESGNLLRGCNATGGSKAVITPVQASPNRGTRTLTSQNMSGLFVKDTQDVERFEAQGDAKFNEDDRNGLAATISYIAAEETVHLRGGEPIVWDSRGRTKATELDSDLRNKVSYGRGKTATTYYSQEQTNGATPFSKVKSPVYVVGDRAELYHDSGLAVYSGNARAWQDDNFVRADKLSIYMNDKRMEAVGHVQTAVYNSRRRVEGDLTEVPVFANADAMAYSDPDRTIHYDGNVDIKQGPDRLTGGVADVYLNKESNEMEKTVAQRNVVLTQPTRRGTGDWVQYTSVDEVAILKGNPARVEDSEKGNTEGDRLTLSVRDSKVTADDARGPLSPGRVRSTHKIRKP